MGGWPAGLYLTALSLRRTADRHALVNELGASSRHLLDFLETEVLQAHDAPMQALMLRSSVLERPSGPLCDAVLDQQHSGPMLEALSSSNLFLIPLDHEGGWYRFHPLFALLLRVELNRREPGLAPALHRRAYAWHRDHGMTGKAIEHAIAAGAHAEAAELIETSWVSYAGAGGYEAVLAWIGQLPEEMQSGDTGLLLVRAWMLSLSAKPEEAGQVIAAAGRLDQSGAGPLPDGFSSAEASLTMLRACCPWGTWAPSCRAACARPSSKARDQPGGRWPAGRSAWACTTGGRPARPTGGSQNRRRWHPRAHNGRPPRRRWPTARSSPARRAVPQNSRCWPSGQRNSSGRTAPKKPAAWSRWPWGYRWPRAAGPATRCR